MVATRKRVRAGAQGKRLGRARGRAKVIRMGGRSQRQILGVLLPLVAFVWILLLSRPDSQPQIDVDPPTKPTDETDEGRKPSLQAPNRGVETDARPSIENSAGVLTSLYAPVEPEPLAPGMWRIRFSVDGPSHWARAMFLQPNRFKPTYVSMNSFLGPNTGQVFARGTGYLLIRANGFRTWASELLTPPVSRELTLHASMQKGLTLSGRVVAQDGFTPIRSASIAIKTVRASSETPYEAVLRRLSSNSAITDREGRFSIQGLHAGQVALNMVNSRAYEAFVDRPVFAGDSGVLMRCAAMVTVTLDIRSRDASRAEPLERARVEYRDPSGTAQVQYARLGTIQSVSSGTAIHTAIHTAMTTIRIPVGAPMPIRVSAAGHKIREQTVTVERESGTWPHIVIELEPARGPAHMLELDFEGPGQLPRTVLALHLPPDDAPRRHMLSKLGHVHEFAQHVDVHNAHTQIPVTDTIHNSRMILVFDNGDTDWADAVLDLRRDKDGALHGATRTIHLQRAGSISFQMSPEQGNRRHARRFDAGKLRVQGRERIPPMAWDTVTLTRASPGASWKSIDVKLYGDSGRDPPVIRRLPPGRYTYSILDLDASGTIDVRPGHVTSVPLHEHETTPTK